MSTSRDRVNPLRPYYIPPTIGDRLEKPSSASTPNVFSTTPRNATATGNQYASKARDMFNDLDYKGVLDDGSPTVAQSLKEFLDDLVWKYTSVLMAQPFEVAKTILQARDQDENAALVYADGEHFKNQFANQGLAIHDNDGSDSEGEEAAFFTYNAPETPTHSYRSGSLSNRRTPMSPLQSPKLPKKPSVPDHYLALRQSDSVMEVIGQLWQQDGVWGVWKGSNATFLYNVLQSLLENWSRSFLSAIFNVPDLGMKDDIDRLIDIATPYPWASLFVAATAAVVTGLILAPLDLVRTRLIMTSVTKGQRRTLATLRALPSYLCHSILTIPTILTSLVNPIFTLSTPLVLRTRFMIDSQASPLTYSLAKFFASSAAILVKLPLETVLRRGQMAVLTSQDYIKALSGTGQRMETVVPPGRYYGIFGTMYHITSAEGVRSLSQGPSSKKGKAKSRAQTPVQKNGQGLEGLWRGWKVNWWGLVGLWTASVVGTGGEGEF